MFKKTLSLILVMLFVLTAFVSCADEAVETDTGTAGTTQDTTPETDPTGVDIDAILADSKNRILVKEGASSYVIVVPAGNEDARKVADDLAKGIKTLAGTDIAVVEDSTAEAEYEILVGETNRAASTALYANVRQNDYAVASSDKKIVVAARLRENLMLASKRLLGEFEAATVDEKSYLWIDAEYNYDKKVDYTLDMLTVGGNNINEYVIAYGDTETDLANAKAIQAMIITACGYSLNLVKASETAAVEKEILVGATNRAASAATGENTYEVKVAGKALVFFYSNEASAVKAWSEYEAKFNEAMEALAEGTKTYELNALTVSGKVAAMTAGQVLYSENFNKDASADTAAVSTAIGWKQSFHRGWKNDPKLEITADGTLKIDGGWTGFVVADASVLEGAYVYTIETDISFIGNELGAFQFFVNSDQTYNDMVAVNTLRGNNNVISFRNADATGKFTGTNDATMATPTQLGLTLVNMTGTKDAATSVTKVASGPVEGTKTGVTECDFIKDAQNNAMYGKKFRLAIEVDCIKGVINVYVDGKLMASLTEGVLTTPGTVTIMAQNSLAELDNFSIKTGTLDGKTNVADPVPGTKPEEKPDDKPVVTAPTYTGNELYNQAFGGDATKPTADVVTELGWGKIPLANAHVDVTYTEDGMAKLASKWGMSSFIDKSSLTNVTKYVLELTAKMDAPAADKEALLNIVFNQNTTTTDFTKANLDCILLSFRSCNENGALAKGGSKIGVNLTRYFLNGSATKQVNMLDSFVLLDVAYGTQFNVRMDVNTIADTIKVYVNNILVIEYTASEQTDEKIADVNAGTIGLWVQNTTAYVDNIKVTDTAPAVTAPTFTGTPVYTEDFGGDATKPTADVVTELGWGKVPLANAHVDVTYTEDGMAKLANKWGMSSFVDKSALDGVTKYVLEMDAKVDAPAADKNALFNIAFNQNNVTADFTKANLDCMLLSFRSCDINGNAVNGGKFLGVNLTRYFLNGSATKQVNIFDKFELIDVDFGETFDIRMDVDTTAGSIKVYVNSILVLDYTASAQTGEKQVTVNAGTIVFWVQNTTAYVDNIAVSKNQ